MRKIEFKGWIIFDEDSCNHVSDMVSQIEHELYNVDGVSSWELEELSNDEIEEEIEEDDEYDDDEEDE